MKMIHEHIEFPRREAVKVKRQSKSCFTYPWHFHTEFEIIYVISGQGTTFVADCIEAFQAGDLVLLGSNLPHFWKSKELSKGSDGNCKVEYIVVQFPSDFFYEAILKYPEFHLIRELLERSSRGMRFSPGFAKNFGKKLITLSQKNGFGRTMLLLELLQLMAKTNQYKLLAGELYQIENHNFNDDRLTKVMHYINTSYLSKVQLSKVAELANLHPSAFCRYFKEQTGKSLSEFINEMRITYACRLLIDGKSAVSQICFDSGFNNLSNFNRRFKKHTGFTPSNYYKEFHRK